MTNNLTDTSPTLPPILYKYMSQAGFLGIINSQSIWATDIFYLNDAAEYHHSVNMVKTEIAKKLKDIVIPLTGFSGAKSDTVKVVGKEGVQKQFLEILDSMLDDLSSFHIFVCSFSEAPDLLSQWRGYCPGGNGLCVGFDSVLLVDFFKERNYRIEKCIYDFDQQSTQIDHMLNQYLEGISEEEIPDKLPNLFNLYAPITNKFLTEFFQIAPIYKDPSFTEEKEWRFISELMLFGNTNLKYREGKSMIIPYDDVSIVHGDSPLPIKKVIIGPTPYPQLSVKSVKSLLQSKGLAAAKVWKSDCPYREW